MQEKFETAAERVRPRILALAKRFAGAVHLEADPEDIVQETLLRLWKAMGEGNVVNADAWAVTAVKNLCVSLYRKARNHTRVSALADVIPGGDAASAQLEAREGADRVQAALEQIPSGTRKLLSLKAAGLSLDQIASITGRPKGSVKSSISIARKQIMQILNNG